MFSYENQGRLTYLVYGIKADDEIDSMTLGMLTNNQISGIAPITFTQIEQNQFVKYNVSSKVSAKQIFNGIVDKKHFLGILKGIVNACISVEEYMINISSVLLDWEYIFTDVSTGETILICLPIKNKKQNNIDLEKMIKELMNSLQFNHNENCDYIAYILNYLNSNQKFTLKGFAKVIEDAFAINNSIHEQTIQEPTHNDSLRIDYSINNPTYNENQYSTTQNVVQQATVVNQTPPMTPSGVGFAVPGQQIQKNNIFDKKEKADEKDISLYYLLCHFSKENVQIYKNQSARKKAEKQQLVQSTQQPITLGQQAVSPVQPVVSPVQPVATPVQPVVSPVQSAVTPVQQKVVPAQPYVPVANTNSQCSMNFGETTVLNEGYCYGETTVLGLNDDNETPSNKVASLVRKKNGERVIINKSNFRIGKEKSYVDFYIDNNRAISRSHAEIIRRGNDYYIIDTNSTNHTYVNDVMIQSNDETFIEDGTIIKLANEYFEFSIK